MVGAPFFAEVIGFRRVEDEVHALAFQIFYMAMRKNLARKITKPTSLASYWLAQWPLCLAITVTGFIYNFGMLASPYFEGALVDSIEAKSTLHDVLVLVGIFIGVIAAVLIARALKRYTVRRFANNTTYAMREILENNILHRDYAKGDENGVGSLLAKVISDVEATVEGMRKLTTEIFDTVVMFFFYIVFMASIPPFRRMISLGASCSYWV